MVDLENSELSFFSTVQKMTSSKFSLPSMIPRVRGKFRVIVFGYRAEPITRNSEFIWLGIPNVPGILNYRYGQVRVIDYPET